MHSPFVHSAWEGAPPEGPEPEDCEKCSTTGKLCEWCGLPPKPAGDDRKGWCACPVTGDADTLSQLELLGYLKDWEARVHDCDDCDGRGYA